MSATATKVPAYLVTIADGEPVPEPCTELDYLCMSYDEAVHALRSGQPALVAGRDTLAVRQALGAGVHEGEGVAA